MVSDLIDVRISGSVKEGTRRIVLSELEVVCARHDITMEEMYGDEG